MPEIHLSALRVRRPARGEMTPLGPGDLVFVAAGGDETTDARQSQGTAGIDSGDRRAAARPEGACGTVSLRHGHDGLRTVRQGGDARRSAARRDLAAVRASAFRSLLRAMTARLRKPLLG